MIKISLQLILRGPINNFPALVQIMAWRRPWLFHWRMYVSIGLNELNKINVPTLIIIVSNCVSMLNEAHLYSYSFYFPRKKKHYTVYEENVVSPILIRYTCTVTVQWNDDTWGNFRIIPSKNAHEIVVWSPQFPDEYWQIGHCRHPIIHKSVSIWQIDLAGCHLDNALKFIAGSFVFTAYTIWHGWFLQ